MLAHKRAAYAQFCAELIIDPKDAEGSGGGGGGAPVADHPLSQSNDSRWHAFFKVRYPMQVFKVRYRGLHQYANGHEFCILNARSLMAHYSVGAAGLQKRDNTIKLKARLLQSPRRKDGASKGEEGEHVYFEDDRLGCKSS